MNFIFVEPSETEDKREEKDRTFPRLRAVATDGRRLHLVEPLNDAAGAVFGMTHGFWRVLRANSKVWIAKLAEEPGQFPNYRKVLPDDTEVKHTASFPGFSLKGATRNSVETLRLFREFPEATPIDMKYLADLGTDDEWAVKWRSPRQAVTFHSANKLAAIMPMQD